MQKTVKKALSFLLVLVMVMGIMPVTAFADQAQAAQSAALPASMDGLSIAYLYNTENVQLTEKPVNRFDALTFESARNEVESAQMILTPDFQVDSFELTMNSLQNEKGNVIPGWAFEVYIQHYVTVEGSKNSPQYGDFKALNYNSYTNRVYIRDVFHPRLGETAWDGTYPDALIPQDAAIAAGENTIAAGNNQGIWVNLNVAGAAPGTYTGYATLTVNGSDMQIPVSVRVYDVTLSDEVHSNITMGIQYDMLEAGEGYITQELADTYYNYLLSKRITPWDRYNYWYDYTALAEYAVTMAADSRITSYRLNYGFSGKFVERNSILEMLTALINENLEQIAAGNNVDLFKKAYFYFANVDEPAGGSTAPTYAEVQDTIDVLDSAKAALLPLLADYPDLQESFLAIPNVVTGPNPNDDTFYMQGCADYTGHEPLTSEYGSVLYTPQFHHFQTAEQRALYADEETVWWYGCCHPRAPYPTFHLNTPLVNNRAINWMMYDYGIDGMLYCSANKCGYYAGETIDSIELYDIWNGYTDSETPGDMMLLYPGAAYGVEGPIGSIRMETIREGSEDYEYFWMLENVFGISDISAYTAGLYDGMIVTGVYDGKTVDPDGDGNTDSSALYHDRRVALLAQLEELNVAENGATEIAPGQEGFVRGDTFAAGKSTTFTFENAAYVAVSFDYKLTTAGTMSVILRDTDNWGSLYYGDFTFDADGLVWSGQTGITAQKLDDGYIRVIMVLSELNRSGTVDNRNKAPDKIGVFDVFSFSTGSGYVDNIQFLNEVPELPEEPTEPEVTEPEVTVPENRGTAFAAKAGTTITVDNAAYKSVSFDYKLTTAGTMSLILRDANNWGDLFYGDFTFDNNGLVWSYQTGITTQKLDDGYIHVIMVLDELNRSGVSDSLAKAPTNVGVFDIFSWTSADGYVDNIQFSMEVPEPEATEPEVTEPEVTEPENLGAEFAAGVGTTITFDNAAYYMISFDYKLLGEGTMSVILRDPNNWTSKVYGDYTFNTTGLAYTYGNYQSGITCSVLEDGYVHVTMKLSELQRSGLVDNRNAAPENIGVLDIYSWTTVGGYIDNVQVAMGCDHSYEPVVTAPTFTTAGYTTYTCVSCGDSYVDNEVEAYSVSVSRWNIALGDEISATFCLDIDSRVENPAAKITVGAETIDAALTKQADGTYAVTIPVAAAQMTENISVQVVAGDLVSNAMTYTIRQYAEYILTGEYREQLKNLVKTMLNYGANAQTYFGYNTGVLANAGYEITEAVEIPTVDASNMVSGKAEGIRFYGASLVFESKVAVRFYFVVDGDISSYSFSTGSEPVLKNDMYYVEVADINPQDYADVITLTVNDTLTVAYSPLTYISRKYYGSDNEQVRNLVAAMYRYYLAADSYLSRGTAFSAGAGTTVTFENNAYKTISFEYKLVTEGTMSVILRDADNWGSLFYGDFAFDANGLVYDYQTGITTEKLDDGYIRVTMDLSKLNRSGTTDNLDKAPTNVGVLDIFSWTTADGYIDNVQYSMNAPEQIVENLDFAAGQEAWAVVEEGSYKAVQFDYKLEAPGTMTVILRDGSWSKYYGGFDFDEKGLIWDYQTGIYTEYAGNGYIRVTMVVDELNRTGMQDNRDNAPESVGVFDIFSSTTVNGNIQNIRFMNEIPELPVTRGEKFEGNVGKTISFDNAGYKTVSFDYKLSSEGSMSVILRDADNWGSLYYGDFTFDANGLVWSYQTGIITEKLADGYIRVTMDLSKLNRSGTADNLDKAPTNVGVLDIFSWTTADGYIDNVQYSLYSAEPDVAELNFNASEETYVEIPEGAYKAIQFDYKLDAPGSMTLILRNADWSKYYGSFDFDENGLVWAYQTGIYTEYMGDGYIRVTMVMDELNRSGMQDNLNNAPEGIAIFDIFSSTTVSGQIKNIQLLKGIPALPVVRGEEFVAGAGKIVEFANGGYETISFDYKLTSAGTMSLILRDADNWGTLFYGDFTFDANGLVWSYQTGITTEKLEDGYIRVTLKLNELNRSGTADNLDKAPAKVGVLDIYGGFTTASGYIDNVQYA